MHWTVKLQGGPQKVNHAAVSVGRYIYSFGGYNSKRDAVPIEDFNAQRKIDVCCLDTDTLRWSVVEYTGSPDAIPNECYGHTAVEYGYQVYLFGGRNDFLTYRTLYCFDAETHSWSLPNVRGALPRARDGHTACVIGNYMYVFGGYEEETGSFSESLHRINLNTFIWEEVRTRGLPPPSTDFHTASAIGSRMYVFGGRSLLDTGSQEVEHYSNQITYLDTTTMTWVRLQAKGRKPCGRRSHSAVVYNNKIYILCGFNSVLGKHFKDMYCFNPETNSWSEVICKGEGPCARRRQCCCIVEDKLYLFGGTSPLKESDYYNGGFSTLHHEKLFDYSDLHVLDFFPTLKRLCMLQVIALRLDFDWLPRVIRREISCMTTNNPIM